MSLKHNMYSIIVRAKKDASAIKAMLKAFHPEWSIDIHTLKGFRIPSDTSPYLSEILEKPKYHFILLGRKDKTSIDYELVKDKPNVVVHVVNKARIRNARIEELAWELSRAKARQRLSICFKNEKLLLGCKELPLLKEPMPYHDVFLLRISEEISKKINLQPGYYLVLREQGGEHYIIDKGKIVGVMKFEDKYSIPKPVLRNSPQPLDIDELVKTNRDYLLLEEKIVVEWLKQFKEEYDKIIVPWSGGKDSTTALFLALKVFGANKVRVAYIEIDMDLPLLREYVETTALKLGVKLLKTRIELREEILRKGLPTHDYRWCTGLKIEALTKIYREECIDSKCLIISGDRDVESETRSLRPPFIRDENGFDRAMPLKQWSTLTLQLYMFLRNIPLNPLYDLGFYRLGCYMCPAMRNWEIFLMLNHSVFNKLWSDDIFKLFIESRKR